MSEHSIRPDFSSFEIPMDVWSEPFWKAGIEHMLLMPRCQQCSTFRWPAGPFCPKCRSQPVDWVAPGAARLYSYTVMPVPSSNADTPPKFRAAALVEFEQAPGVRLVTVLVDAPRSGAIQIGAALDIDWISAANAQVPVVRLSPPRRSVPRWSLNSSRDDDLESGPDS